MLKESGAGRAGHEAAFKLTADADFLGARLAGSFLPSKTCCAKRNRFFAPSMGALASCASISFAPAKSLLMALVAARVRAKTREQRGQPVLVTTARLSTTSDIWRPVSSIS